MPGSTVLFFLTARSDPVGLGKIPYLYDSLNPQISQSLVPKTIQFP